MTTFLTIYTISAILGFWAWREDLKHSKHLYGEDFVVLLFMVFFPFVGLILGGCIIVIEIWTRVLYYYGIDFPQTLGIKNPFYKK